MLGPKTGWPGSPQQNVSCCPDPRGADSLKLGRPRAGWQGGSTTAGWLGEAAELERYSEEDGWAGGGGESGEFGAGVQSV